MCFCTITERAAVRLFIYLLDSLPLPFTLSCLEHSAVPLPPPLLSHCPCSSPICDVEAAIFSRWLPRLSPWRVTLMTNWVWKWRWWPVKAMPLPPPCTPWTYTQRQLTHRYMTAFHVCMHVSYTALVTLWFDTETKRGVMLQIGWWPGCKTKKTI